jgi:hypothetical protein
MIAGAALGGAAIQGPHAQAKPPAYVITHTEVTDEAAFKEFASKTPSVMQDLVGSTSSVAERLLHSKGMRRSA